MFFNKIFLKFFGNYNKKLNIAEYKDMNTLSKEDIIKLLRLKEAMLDINRFILEFNDITELFTLVLDIVMANMEFAEFGSVLIIDKDNIVKMAVCRGYGEEYKKKFCIKLEDSFFWKMSKGRIDKSQIINDIQFMAWDVSTKDMEGSSSLIIRSSLSTPVTLDGVLYGLINIDSTHNNVFNDAEVEILEYLKKQMEIGINKHMLYQKTVYLSRYDRLTNIYNRGYFEELFEKHLESAVKNNEIFHLIFFDINSLKMINDNYGHLAGDKLIIAFAEHISRIIHTSDIFARLAGDEFAAILFNSDRDSLVKKFDNLLEELKTKAIKFEGHDIICSFGYGISEFPKDGSDYNQLFKDVDKKMYEHKQRYKEKNNIANRK